MTPVGGLLMTPPQPTTSRATSQYQRHNCIDLLFRFIVLECSGTSLGRVRRSVTAVVRTATASRPDNGANAGLVQRLGDPVHGTRLESSSPPPRRRTRSTAGP